MSDLKYSELLGKFLSENPDLELAKEVFYDRDRDCYCALGLIVHLRNGDIKDSFPDYLPPEFIWRLYGEFIELGKMIIAINDSESETADSDRLRQIINLLEEREL